MGFVSALVKATIRTTAMHISTIMSNINPDFRNSDSNFAAVEGEPPPALFHVETAPTAGKVHC